MSQIKRTIIKPEHPACSICGSTAAKVCHCKYLCPHPHHLRKKNGKPYPRSMCEECDATCSHPDKLWDNVSKRFVPPDRNIVVAFESPQQPQQPQLFDVTWDDLDAYEAAQIAQAAQAVRVVELSENEIAAMVALFDNPASRPLW
jgi:hypothetical protein